MIARARCYAASPPLVFSRPETPTATSLLLGDPASICGSDRCSEWSRRFPRDTLCSLSQRLFFFGGGGGGFPLVFFAVNSIFLESSQVTSPLGDWEACSPGSGPHCSARTPSTGCPFPSFFCIVCLLRFPKFARACCSPELPEDPFSIPPFYFAFPHLYRFSLQQPPEYIKRKGPS